MATKRKRNVPRRTSAPIYYECDIWKENFYFFIGWKPEVMAKHLKKHYNYETEFDGVAARCIEWISNDASSSCQMIWTLRKPKDGPKFYANLAHECVHGAMHILDRRGVKLSGDNHEALTYLTETLVRKALGG